MKIVNVYRVYVVEQHEAMYKRVNDGAWYAWSESYDGRDDHWVNLDKQSSNKLEAAFHELTEGNVWKS